MRQLFEPAPEAPRRWYWAPIAVLILGLMSIAMLAWTPVGRRSADGGEPGDRARGHRSTERRRLLASVARGAPDRRPLHRPRPRRSGQSGPRHAPGVDAAARRPARQRRDRHCRSRSLSLRTEAEALEAALTDFRNISEKRLAWSSELASARRWIKISTPPSSRSSYMPRSCGSSKRNILERDRANFRLRVVLTVGAWAVIVTAAALGLWSRERRRQQAADTLRASQRWLATTLSSIGDAVVTTDLEGQDLLHESGSRTADRTGLGKRRAASRSARSSRVFGEDSEPIEDPVAKVLRTGRARACPTTR